MLCVPYLQQTKQVHNYQKQNNKQVILQPRHTGCSINQEFTNSACCVNTHHSLFLATVLALCTVTRYTRAKVAACFPNLHMQYTRHAHTEQTCMHVYTPHLFISQTLLNNTLSGYVCKETLRTISTLIWHCSTQYAGVRTELNMCKSRHHVKHAMNNHNGSYGARLC